MPGDAVTIDQGDEVGRSETAQCGLGKMRIGGKEVGGRGADVGEIASPAARNQDLPARLRRMIEEQDATTALPGEATPTAGVTPAAGATPPRARPWDLT